MNPPIFRLYFSRRWWWTTLVVLLATGVMVRLGIWQLDRLSARRAFNDHVRLMQSAETLDLNSVTDVGILTGMDYRSATARGTYDYANTFALRNQYWGDPEGAAQYGFHLLTPLNLSDDLAVLVDRGWIPSDDATPDSWRQYEGSVVASVTGILRLPLLEGEMGGGVPNPTPVPGERMEIWNYINLEEIQKQVPIRLLPVYLEQAPSGDQATPPYQALPFLDLSEGSHLGYAIQWFFFAALVFFGYPVYLQKQ